MKRSQGCQELGRFKDEGRVEGEEGGAGGRERDRAEGTA